MAGCCPPNRYEAVFDERFARRRARRYERRGLGRTERRMVAFIEEHGIAGASVLEIGGGVGELQIELLRKGAASATNLEVSGTYEGEAQRLLRTAGLDDRVQRRLLDIAEAPDEVPAADVVVLHRVVCCYHDYQRLLTAAGTHARRLLVFSHPPRNVASRLSLTVINFALRVQGNEYQGYTHPPERMLDVLQAVGLRPSYRHHGPVWHVQGLSR